MLFRQVCQPIASTVVQLSRVSAFGRLSDFGQRPERIDARRTISLQTSHASVATWEERGTRNAVAKALPLFPRSVQLAGLDQTGCKGTRVERRMVLAGRMTARARTNIGAWFEARPKSVGLGLGTDM